jgi:hypothetical protein
MVWGWEGGLVMQQKYRGFAVYVKFNITANGSAL